MDPRIIEDDSEDNMQIDDDSDVIHVRELRSKSSCKYTNQLHLDQQNLQLHKLFCYIEVCIMNIY